MISKEYLFTDIDNTDIEIWIKGLGLESILLSNPVQRLKKIRFLGTMMYTTSLVANYSRYDHSLGVAKLAYEMGKKFGLSSKECTQLVLISLLHDIGHLPFSHASEVFFRQTWGRYHTGHGGRLTTRLARALKISGEISLSSSVHKANKIFSMRSGNDLELFNRIAWEIFHGPLSADTLDGINRAAKSVGLSQYSSDLIIKSLFFNDYRLRIEPLGKEEIFRFTELKRKIYTEYVYSTAGISSEAMLTRALELAFPKQMDRNDFITLDDETAIKRIRENKSSSVILDNLESKNLYYSLKDVNFDKYKQLNKIYKILISNGNKELTVRKHFEKIIQQQLSALSHKIILHSSILLNVPSVKWQKDLFDRPSDVKGLMKNFGTINTYGRNVEVLFPKDMSNTISSFFINPNTKLITEINKEDRINSSVEKHSGAYMTPFEISSFLADWAIRSTHDKILDPSSGEGAFIHAAISKLESISLQNGRIEKNIYGVERDINNWTICINKLSGYPLLRESILYGNFFNVNPLSGIRGVAQFDVIMGNPPYIRHHRFNGEERRQALEVAQQFGIKLSKRVSSWVPYLIHSISFLKDEGRLAMVLPFELFTTDYAKPIRDLLAERFRSCIFVTINKFVFPSVQQDVVLLLASNDENTGLKTIEFDSIDQLSTERLKDAAVASPRSHWLGDKWTGMVSRSNLLQKIGDLQSSGDLVPLKSFANISIGLVTGNNSFFLQTNSEVTQNQIERKWIKPIVSKASHIPGCIFNTYDLEQLRSNDQKVNLLCIDSSSNLSSDPSLESYIEEGKRLGVNQGYKCRKRWPWYSVPIQKVPDCFITYMSGKLVRLVMNNTSSYSTNTIHNLYLKENFSEAFKRATIVIFYNSLTLLCAELIGRAYGGGVLKLEINEANNILIPNLSKFDQHLIDKLSGMLDKLNAHLIKQDFNIIKEIDELVLLQGVGLSRDIYREFREEWLRLINRRTQRF